MNRVVHFEIHAEDPQRAILFYSTCFFWQFHSWGGPEDYWLITTGPKEEPGINGGLIRRRGTIDGEAVIAYVCTIEVASLDGQLEKVQQAGGTIALARMPIPGVGWLAYCKDTEGNIFGMMQNDPAAT